MDLNELEHVLRHLAQIWKQEHGRAPERKDVHQTMLLAERQSLEETGMSVMGHGSLHTEQGFVAPHEPWVWLTSEGWIHRQVALWEAEASERSDIGTQLCSAEADDDEISGTNLRALRMNVRLRPEEQAQRLEQLSMHSTQLGKRGEQELFLSLEDLAHGLANEEAILNTLRDPYPGDAEL